MSTGDGVVLVRNAAQPDVELSLTAEQWRSLVDAVKDDTFEPDPASEAAPPRD